MFTHLSVKNFAIIEDAEISFRDGLTVLTGETGAGKSLIIDSIDLLLGERANSELVRNGEDKATIIGTFKFNNKRLGALLDKLEIEHVDNILEINRTLGTTIIVVTHELASIFAVAKNSIFLDKTIKTISAKGNPSELLKNPPNEQVFEFLTRGVKYEERTK